MTTLSRRSALAALVLSATGVLSGATDAGAQRHSADLPHLRPQGSATQLVVDGRPFLVLGGELGNSSASDPAYMRPRWSRLRAMHLNTVIAPAYWELIEPREGQFDFASVDSLLAAARQSDLRVVLLWFGSW